MHQTLYIDIDEEITSVVERLRKAQAKEIIMVVPKRALLIQSIVNLRLLKKEADGMGIQLMIVTQDKLGKLLIEKAGILVQQKLDDVLEEEGGSGEKYYQEQEIQMPLAEEESGAISNNSKTRMETIGSENFFDEKGAAINRKMTTAPMPRNKENEEEKITNTELVVGIGNDIKKKSSFMDMSLPPRMLSNIGSREKMSVPQPAAPQTLSSSPSRPQLQPKMTIPDNFPARKPSVSVEAGNDMPPQMSPEKRLEDFFSGDFRKREDPYEDKRSFSTSHPGIFKKVILAVVIILFLGGMGAGAYFFLPQATIALVVKEKVKEQDCDVTGSITAASSDYEKEVIPAKLLSVNDEITQNYPLTGSGGKASSGSIQGGQKAHGTITIYNEFSSSSQPLVATTRFVTDDGKIYRLTKAVTVPGTSKDGDQVKPGTVDAEVEADVPGDQYNIGPSKFSIPGFENNKDKYSKIYGKSSGDMSGGANGGNAAPSSNNDPGQTRAITDNDVAAAKAQALKALNDDIKKKIKDSADKGMVVSDDAINIDEATYKLSQSVGAVTDKFQITVQTKATAIAFKEDDLKDMVGNIIAKSNGTTFRASNTQVSLEYGKILPDFKAGLADIRVHGVSKIGAALDAEKFKSDILGKTNDEFEAYLSSYPDIEKAEVTYWPPFVSSRIPLYAKRVNITLDPE